MSLQEKIYNAGVVGAGGGGFPAHIKAKSKVEFVLANGAECEPLIHKDYEIMKNFPAEIIDGMNLLMKITDAGKGYFGIKAKNSAAIEAVEKNIGASKIEMSLLGDFYPSGDEYELVYESTKRLIPAHGLPLDVGCLVNNVETLYNISLANKDIPVTEKFLSVAGAVKKPSSFFVPLGTKFGDLIKLAGGTILKEYGIFVSGILMGKLTFDLDQVVTKTTAGVIILPIDHYLITRTNKPVESMNRIGKSACDQCSYCTELCPRYLLGYDVQPHKVMRTLGFSTTGKDYWNQFADLCCSCGLCSLYSCPEDLYPREACDQSKAEMRQNGFKYEQSKPVKVHPIKEGRRVPMTNLLQRLDLTQYETKTPFVKEKFNPTEVKLLLKQHAGKKASPIVTEGTSVSKGEVVASVGFDEVGSKIHASISGTVNKVTDEYIIITQ